jgi:predicted Zn-dependent peptidase
MKPLHTQSLPLSTVLDNGMTALLDPIAGAESVAVGVFVRAGSRDESLDVWGVSHFLEHMLFKGSERMGWQALSEQLDDIGARYNAYTTQEVTVYYASVLPEFGERVLEIMVELMSPALRVEDFETERGVILEEIAMYADEPPQRVYERAMAEHFGSHPLGRSIIGTVQSISAMTREQMHNYYQRFYAPGNMAVSVAGRFDADAMRAQLGRTLGKIGLKHDSSAAPKSGVALPARRNETIERSPDAPRRVVHETDAKLSRAYVNATITAPGLADERRYAARVLADVIGDSDGSRLYWALTDPAIAEEADLSFYPHDGCGLYMLALVSDPARVHESIDLAERELSKFASTVTEDEIVRARNKIASQLTLGSESSAGRMRGTGTRWAYGLEQKTLEEEIDRLLKVNVHEVRALAEAFPLRIESLVELSPATHHQSSDTDDHDTSETNDTNDMSDKGDHAGEIER